MAKKKRWNLSANVGSKVRVVRDHLSRYVTILNIISDTMRLIQWSSFHGIITCVYEMEMSGLQA